MKSSTDYRDKGTGTEVAVEWRGSKSSAKAVSAHASDVQINGEIPMDVAAVLASDQPPLFKGQSQVKWTPTALLLGT